LSFRIFLVALLSLCVPLASAQVIPLSAGMQFPDIPYASITGTDAVVLNPAALFLNKPLGVQLYHSFPNEKFSGNNGILMSAAGVGFGYQRLTWGTPTPDGVSRYDFAVSSRVVRNIYTGLSYTYYKTNFKPLDKAHAWNLSIMAHLGRFAAASAEVLNVNKHKFYGAETDMGYRLSAALRPLGERFTLGGNMLTYRGQDIKDAAWRISARAEVARGLVFYGGYDDQHMLGVGLEFHLSGGLIGVEGFFDDQTKHLGTTVYSGYSVAPRDNILSGPGKILRVDLSGEIPEEHVSRVFAKSPATVYQKLAAIEAARKDRQVRGLLLTISNPKIGWGKLTEFRRAIADFRKTGKTVICYLGVSPGNGAYYLASAADDIYMLPVDALNLTGLRAEVTFYKGTLDKLGVEAEIEKQGEYKDYPNLFTDTSFTAPQREELESLLDDLYDQIVGEIAPDRQMSVAELSSLIDEGPFTSAQAESLLLVDGRYYPEDFEARLPEMFGGNYLVVSSDFYRQTPPFRERFGEQSEIALISVAGSITNGNSGSSFIEGSTSGSATISRAIRAAKDSPAVKAIVMRLDTPGGNAIASDLIWGELMAARQRKPVIVSMSDVCASGGYYIAAASDKIYLDPTTVTGSIGVFWGKANLEGLYHKLGMTTEVIQRGKHANMYSMAKGFTPEEREVVKRQVNDLYGNFLTIVAQNRNLSKDSVNAIARGRVWSGNHALTIGLGDAVGGVLDAINNARIEGGISDYDYRVVEMPERRLSLLDLPDMLLSKAGGWLGLKDSEQMAALKSLALSLDSDSPQMRLPYQLTIQ
jgi:protease IV